jgi:hypothetical protein
MVANTVYVTGKPLATDAVQFKFVVVGAAEVPPCELYTEAGATGTLAAAADCAVPVPAAFTAATVAENVSRELVADAGTTYEVVVTPVKVEVVTFPVGPVFVNTTVYEVAPVTAVQPRAIADPAEPP